MKTNQWVYLLYVLLSLTAILVGCNSNPKENAGLALIQTTHPSPTSIHSTLKGASPGEVSRDIESIDDIYDVAVIKGKKETLVVYKVKHMQRFHMKKIEQEVNSILEKKYPDEDFIVSSDYKIFMEAVELREKLKDPNYPEKDAQKQFDKIVELKKELT
jgi:hypothetical protein